MRMAGEENEEVRRQIKIVDKEKKNQSHKSQVDLVAGVSLNILFGDSFREDRVWKQKYSTFISSYKVK